LRIYCRRLATEIPISRLVVNHGFPGFLLLWHWQKEGDDALLYQKTKVDVRKNIKFYNLQFIDSNVSYVSWRCNSSIHHVTVMSPGPLKRKSRVQSIFYDPLFVIIGSYEIFTSEFFRK